MSGSIGGKRIKRAEVQPTLDNYINKVLKGFPGFVSAQITGSYNAGTKADHGDIDIAVHIKGTDVKTVKKEFKNYLDGLDDETTPRFVFGKNEGKKSQLYGAIVTCGFPINGRPEDYVQIDNIIVTNENEQRFQKEFLDLDAAKQGLIMGLMRVILHHKDPDKILEYIGMTDLPKLPSNQEYEFVLSSAGLSFRRVTLNNEMREASRDELWRSANWDIVKYILSDFNLKDSYEDLLIQVEKMVRNNDRSRQRIVGIMKSMIRVGPGEVGTPKGDGKLAAIELAEKTLKVFESLSLKEMIKESCMSKLIDYILEEVSSDPKSTVMNYLKQTPYNKRNWRNSGVTEDQYNKFCDTGKNVWFDDPEQMFRFLNNNWNKYKNLFADNKDIMKDIIYKSYEIVNGKTYNTVPFVISYGNNFNIYVRRDINEKDQIISVIEECLQNIKHKKWSFGTGFGMKSYEGELFEKIFKNRLRSTINKTSGDIDNIDKLAREIINKLNVEEPSLIQVVPQGKKNSKRQIFDKDFSFKNVSSDSGKEIADIVLKYDNKDVMYLSLKDGLAQTSSLSYSDILRTGFKEYGKGKDLECYKSFCSMLGVDPDIFHKWYFNGDFKTSLKIKPDKEKIKNLIKAILGCGYTYVNSNGHIYDIPTDYKIESNFNNITKALPRGGNEIKSLFINGEIFGIKSRIVFRSSDGYPFPFRFMIQTISPKELDSIYEIISSSRNK